MRSLDDLQLDDTCKLVLGFLISGAVCIIAVIICMAVAAPILFVNVDGSTTSNENPPGNAQDGDTAGVAPPDGNAAGGHSSGDAVRNLSSTLNTPDSNSLSFRSTATTPDITRAATSVTYLID